VLKLNPADHPRPFKQRTETCGPIGNGKAGIIACHQTSRNEEKKRQDGNYDSKTVMGGIVAGGGQKSSLKLLILAFASLAFVREIRSGARDPRGQNYTRVKPSLPDASPLVRHGAKLPG
jgi:hypothetical protein